MNSLFSIISSVPDYRHGNRMVYPLDYLLLVVFTGVMSGFSTWTEFELYAELHEEDLKETYKNLTDRELKSYIPSHDTFAHVMQSLDPVAFQKAFADWVSAIVSLKGQHISLDGKTMRGVKKLDPDAEAHTVTAYLPALRLSLDQVFISKKSNEINAVRELLDLIDSEGAVFTADAIVTQTDIVDKIIEKKADYVFSVKNNQPGTYFEIEELFKPFYKDCINKIEMTEGGHGRIETRTMESILDPFQFSEIEGYKRLNAWNGLRTVCKMTRTRVIKKTGQESTETSYFISSLSDPSKIFNLIREHWAVENNLHYCLDVFFNEDRSLRRKGNAHKNVNIVYKAALFFLERVKASTGRSFNALKKICATGKPSDILALNFSILL